MSKYFYLFLILLLMGCGNAKDKDSLTFKVLDCEIKTHFCTHTETHQFKARRYDNTVYVNIYDESGAPLENHFLQKCEVFDKSNWKCEYLSLINGKLVDSNIVRSNAQKNGLYTKYEITN